jgi:hypothetical protein
MSTQITPTPDPQSPNFESPEIAQERQAKSTKETDSMSAQNPQPPNPVQEVLVEYNENNDTVTVTPTEVNKGATVRFKSPKGVKLRIEFLLPNSKETDSVSDSEEYTLSEGGTYHFKCFFTPLGATSEVCPKIGGVIDVLPRRP